MENLLQRVFKIQPGETALVVAFGGIIFINSVSLMISEVVSVAGFLAEVGTSQLLVVWVVSMVLLALIAGSQSFIIDRFDRRWLLRIGAMLILALYLIIRLLFVIGAPHVVSYSLLFLLYEQQMLFFPLVFWVFANDIFSTPQAKRLFPLIGTFPLLGELVGLILMTFIPDMLRDVGLASVDLLYFNAGLLLISYLILTIALRRLHTGEIAVHDSSPFQTLIEGWQFVRDVPIFRFLAISTAGIFIGSTILEYNFLTLLDEFAGGREFNFERFYSLFWLAETVIALIFEALIFERLMERMQLKSISLVLPAILLMLLLASFIAPTLAVAVAAWGLAYMLVETLGVTSGKTMQSLVPEKRRGRVSIFMDSYVRAFARIGGVILIGAVLIGLPSLSGSGQAHRVYVSIGLAAMAVALWAAWMLRQVYDDTLLNWRLKRRRHEGVRGTFIRKLEKTSPDE